MLHLLVLVLVLPARPLADFMNVYLQVETSCFNSTNLSTVAYEILVRTEKPRLVAHSRIACYWTVTENANYHIWSRLAHINWVSLVWICSPNLTHCILGDEIEELDAVEKRKEKKQKTSKQKKLNCIWDKWCLKFNPTQSVLTDSFAFGCDVIKSYDLRSDSFFPLVTFVQSSW